MKSFTQKLGQQKLALSFLLIIFIFIAFEYTTRMGIHAVGDLTQTIYEHPLVVSNASLQAALKITKMNRNMEYFVMTTSSDEEKKFRNSMAENEKAVYRHLDTIRDHIIGNSGMALERETRKLFENWKPIRAEVIRLFTAGQKEQAIAITKEKGAQHVAKLESKMQELTAYARNKADTFYKIAKTKQSNLESSALLLTILGVVISLIIAIIAVKLTLETEERLRTKRNKLQKALDEIKTLQGVLPICMHCKGIRDDKGSWTQLEKYISDHSDVQFSHGICEKCLKEHYPDIEA